MREKDKKEYLDKYQEAKKKGIPFFPDALFKDAAVALGIFIILIVLSALVGAALGDRVDPSVEFDPEPEWYFLFLFQLLKYFPGSLEFLGVVVLPAIVILALFALPWLDRSRRRHFSGRPVVVAVTGLFALGAVFLTVLSLVEQPPPSGGEAAGDAVALLYTENCSGCHGGALAASESTDLVKVISAGGHEGMPSWSADLSADEIDALAGFILSPRGHEIFGETCAACHEVTSLVEATPSDLRSALENGNAFTAHASVALPPSIASLEKQDATALLNFLSAPDGQRLFAANCSSCHGAAVAFAGNAEELRVVIETGGEHVDMPAMGGVLSDEEISLLAGYVVAPNTASDEAQELFEQNCTVCHGSRVPTATSVEAARNIIVTGGGHETMPVWGEILTSEQLDALTIYALESARGTPAIAGQAIFAEQCAICHGEFGEGGLNPTNESIVIAPISTASYLQTRDDVTIHAVISRGQPDLGMSPFSLEFGGSLDEEDINSLVAFVRAWEADPPVELPPEIERAPLLGGAPEVFAEFCSQCHGPQGEGGIGPSFQDPAFHAGISDDDILTAIGLGHSATAMIRWGEVLTDEQMAGLVRLIRMLEVTGESPAKASRFSRDVLPIFEENCGACHGSLGGWNSDTYRAVMTTGNDAPVVIPGDPDASLLVQLLRDPGTRSMPPRGMLPEREIQLIIDWIASGAANN
ncbi:MAG: c-type cytochrome [Acidimicrobiia bacterium]|nr:c-type cytochrome [Acidimicrobiia bacterium]